MLIHEAQELIPFDKYFNINVNPDTTLFVSIPNLYLSFKKVIQDASRLLTKKNYSHTVMKAKYFPTDVYFDFYVTLQVKLMNVIPSFASLYTSVVKQIPIQVSGSYFQM